MLLYWMSAYDLESNLNFPLFEYLPLPPSGSLPTHTHPPDPDSFRTQTETSTIAYIHPQNQLDKMCFQHKPKLSPRVSAKGPDLPLLPCDEISGKLQVGTHTARRRRPSSTAGFYPLSCPG